MAVVSGSSAAIAITPLLLALGAPTAASAGSIRLEIEAETHVLDGELSVQLVLRNAGDEEAASVRPLLSFRGQSVRGETNPELAPGESWETALELPAAGLEPGRWPFRIAIDYTDTSGYPFQALTVRTVTVGTVPPAALSFLALAAPALANSGTLAVSLKNRSDAVRTVEVAVDVPEGIELAEPIAPLELAGWEERSLEVALVNRTGLPGSRYSIFASAEYDDGGVHQTVVASAPLEIVAPQSLLERHGTLLLGLAGLIVLAWVTALPGQLARQRR